MGTTYSVTIAELITEAGGTRAVADALWVHIQTVRRWRQSGRAPESVRLAMVKLAEQNKQRKIRN